MVAERLDRVRPRTAQDDEGVHELAAVAVGHADDRGLEHVRVLLQHILDLARVDVEATDEDHLFLPSADEEVAVVVELANVAGVQPAVVKRLGRGRRQVPVAAHQLWAARQHLADPPRPAGAVPVLQVLQHQFGVLERQPHRAGLQRLGGIVVGQDRAGLGLPVPLQDRYAGRLVPAPEQRSGQRGGT